jgi:multiple sugar transport system permease protein
MTATAQRPDIRRSPQRSIGRLESMRQRERAGKIVFFSIAAILSLLMLLPFFWMITTAFKSNSEIYQVPPALIPHQFLWKNFTSGMKAVDFGRLFFNSAVIAVLCTIGAVGSSMLVGYGLSRIKFRGRKFWFYCFVGSMILPGIVGIIPLFEFYLSIGWFNTWLPLIIPAFLGNPFYIFLARQFYMTIPRSLDEAAKIDGANHWQIFTRVMVPLTKPVWITMAIFAFQGAWNDYLNPLVYLSSPHLWTLALGMAGFAGSFAGQPSSTLNQFMATDILYMFPPLIVFFCFQKYYMQGLGTLGGKR